jgi:predicted PurR-regulated permease PerM
MPMERGVPIDKHEAPSRDELTATWVELSIRIGVLALLLYWTFTLIRPFVTIAIWSAVLTVALYPVYEWMVGQLGGRRRLAALLLTVLSLLIVIGPITWLVLGLVDGIQTVSERLYPELPALPPPPDTIKSWPLVGEPIYQFWELASSNLRAALGMIIPQLKPLGSVLLQVGADAGVGALKFFVAIILAGFLFSPAPRLLDGVRKFSRRVASARGEEFVGLAGATIRSVSRGVIGISVLQALLVGVGLLVAGIPGASLITFAVLILGIIQIGPSIILIPLIIWTWMTMETTAALLFTAYMIPVNLLDNILRPLVMGHGLSTPMPVILLGVIGGTISYGITGLFLGPIVLAVFWELLVAWLRESESAQ